jgi:hypothetical protein
MAAGSSCPFVHGVFAIRPLRPTRFVVGLCCFALLAAAGCGGDEEEDGAGGRTATDRSTQTAERTEREATGTATAPEETETEAASPEDQPGGAGDEEPVRSQALFSGRGGRVTPRLVRVPAFIAIRVELRSADGRRYALRFGRRTLRVDEEVSSVSARFDGLRPGRSLVGDPVGGAGTRVRVEASAEPGP